MLQGQPRTFEIVITAVLCRLFSRSRTCGSRTIGLGCTRRVSRCDLSPVPDGGTGVCVGPEFRLLKGMIDLKLEQPVTEEVEVDTETLAAIDRGLKAAEEGRSVPIEQARQMIRQWISKFESQNRR